MSVLLYLLLATTVPVDCHPVDGDRIFADDLAQVIPAFAGLPPRLILGYGPTPGTERIIREDELMRIAKAHGIPPDSSWRAACFAAPMSRIENAAVVAAMLEALGFPATIEIHHLGPALVPPGKLVFPRGSLGRPPRGDSGEKLVWRGFVQYSENRRLPVSATVSIHATLSRVVARQDLPAGHAVGVDAVRKETYEGFPGADQPIAELEEVIGRLPRHSIRANQAVFASELALALAVRKGDRVQVLVKNGAARLELEAQVETDGRAGDWIQVRNLQSGKQFRGQVEASGKVVVMLKGMDQ